MTIRVGRLDWALGTQRGSGGAEVGETEDPPPGFLLGSSSNCRDFLGPDPDLPEWVTVSGFSDRHWVASLDSGCRASNAPFQAGKT